MSDFSARKTPIITAEPEAKSKKLDHTKEKYSAAKRAGKISVGTSPLSEDTKNEFAIRKGSSLKKLRISASTEKMVKPAVKAEPALKPDTLSVPAKKTAVREREEGKFSALPDVNIRAPRRAERIEPELSVRAEKKVSSYFSEEPLEQQVKQQYVKNEPASDILPDLNAYRLSSVIGAALTGIWFLVAAVYAQFYMGLGEVFSQQPHIIGGFLAGILAPVALLWMIIAHMQRGDEVRQYAVALRDELKTLDLSNPSEMQSKKSVQHVDVTDESKVALGSIHKARAGLRHEIKHLNDISEKTGKQLDQLNTTLSDRAAKLLNMTQEIEKRTASLETVAVKKISAAAVAVPRHEVDDEKAQAVLDKTDSLTEKMDERVKALNAVLGKMEGTLGNMESKGENTADRLSKAIQDSSSNVNALESIIAKSIEKLTKATAEAKGQTESLIETSAEKVEALNKTGEKTSESIARTLKLIDEGREKVEATSKVMSAQAEKTAESVEQQAADMRKAQDHLAKRIDDMHLQISEPLAAVNKAVDKAVDKHGEMEKTLTQRIDALNEASDKAVGKTETIREGLRHQAQEMSTLMGQIAGHSRSVKAMLKDENENLGDNINLALEKVSSIGKALRGESEKLEGVTASAEERIVKMGSTLSNQCMNAVKNTGHVINDFKNIETIMEDNIKSLLSQSGDAKAAISDIAVQLGKSADAVEPVYSKATSKMDQARDRFEKMSSGFETRTNSNLNKLKDFEDTFNERLQTLSASAEDASKILEKSSNSLGTRVSDIDQATLNAEEKLRNIDNVFKNHVSDIHLTTDQALLKIDTVQKAMNTHYQDLSASVAESLAQMKDVGEQFVTQTEQVQKLSSKAVDGLDVAGSKADDKIKKLNKLTQSTTEQMESMLHKVQSEAQRLLTTSSSTLSEMKKTGEDFANRAKMIEDQMRGSVQSTKKYGDELNKQVDKVSKTSVRSAEDIEKAMAQLAAKLLDVKDISKDVKGEVANTRDKLSFETEHLADVSLKASRVVEEAANSYVSQSAALSKATTEAATHIEKVREGDWRVQRDAFLNSTRFILESLHSLSVDLTRMIDGDIQEKAWKAYQKGDIATFTRSLIDNKEKLPHDKLARKYSDDNEFRTYINRFIRQFEDLYEQAGKNDYGDLFATTFASSDVGGLYAILCDVAGRESIVKKHGRRRVA